MAALLLVILSAVAFRANGNTEIDNPTAYTIAILPFADYAGETTGENILMPLIRSRIAESGFNVVDSDTLRQVLRKNRIRTFGSINSAEAATIADELDVNFILLGSIDVFLENEIPEAGFSARLLDTRNMRIFWAVSEAASGDDFTGLLGIGQIRQADRLAEKLVENAFKNFEKSIYDYMKQSEAIKKSPTIALVTFDNLSGQKFAGDVITTFMLTEFIDRGVGVIEPGTVNELFRSQNRALRGEIDYEMLAQLRSHLNVDYVITGNVNLFKAGMAGVEGSGPEVEFDGRCLDSESGRIIGAYEFSRRGTNSSALLHSGSSNSLGELSRRAVDDFVKKVEKDIR